MPVTDDQLARIEREVYGNECRCCARPIKDGLEVADRDADDWPRCTDCADRKAWEDLASC